MSLRALVFDEFFGMTGLKWLRIGSSEWLLWSQ